MDNIVFPGIRGEQVSSVLIECIVIEHKSLLNSCSIERPIRCLAFSCPMREGSVIKPSVLNGKRIREGNVLKINIGLARRFDNEESSIEGRIRAHESGELLFDVEESIRVGKDNGIKIEEDDLLVLNQLQSSQLGAIDGGRSGTEG